MRWSLIFLFALAGCGADGAGATRSRADTAPRVPPNRIAPRLPSVPTMVNAEHADIVHRMYDEGLLGVPMVRDTSNAYLQRVAKGEMSMANGAKAFDQWILGWIKTHPGEYAQARAHPIPRPQSVRQ